MSNTEPADNMGPGGNNNNAASFQPPVDVGASSGGQGPGGNSNNAIPLDEVGFNYNPYQTNKWWDSAQYGMNAADVFMVEDNTNGMADEYKQYLYDSVRQGWGGDTDLEKQRQGWEINKRGLRPWLKERAQAWNVSNGFGPSGSSGMSAADQAKAKEERIVAAEASIRNQLGVFGIAMTPDGMRGIATQAVDNNWSQDKLQDILLQANDWATTHSRHYRRPQHRLSVPHASLRRNRSKPVDAGRFKRTGSRWHPQLVYCSSTQRIRVLV